MRIFRTRLVASVLASTSCLFSIPAVAQDTADLPVVELPDGRYTMMEVRRYTSGLRNEYEHPDASERTGSRRLVVSEDTSDVTPKQAAHRKALQVTSDNRLVAQYVVPDTGVVKIKTHEIDGEEVATLVYLSGDGDHYAVHAVLFAEHPSLPGLKLVEWVDTCPTTDDPDRSIGFRCIDAYLDRSEELQQKVLALDPPLYRGQDVPALNSGLGWGDTNWGVVSRPTPADWTQPADGPVRIQATRNNFGWGLIFVVEEGITEVQYRVRGKSEYVDQPGMTVLPGVDEPLELEVRYRGDGAEWTGPVGLPFDPAFHQAVHDRRMAEVRSNS